MLVAPALELPIERGLAGPGMLADTIVRRWQDHQPLNRLEGIYAREGLPLAKSTICTWHEQLAALAHSLVEAMFADAFTAPYLCVDATGVLVQAKERCKNGHFWVLVAPDRHVLYRFSEHHDSAAVDDLLRGYEGYLVADAHAVYDTSTKMARSPRWPAARTNAATLSRRSNPILSGPSLPSHGSVPCSASRGPSRTFQERRKKRSGAPSRDRSSTSSSRGAKRKPSSSWTNRRWPPASAMRSTNA